MPRATKRTKERNTQPIANRTVVSARVNRWKNADLANSSLYGYIRQIQEFHDFCVNNEPSVLRGDEEAAALQQDLELPDSKKIVCKFKVPRLKITGYAAFELFMGSKVRPDGTAYVKEYYGGYRSAFKKIFMWQNIKDIGPFDDLMSKIISGITRFQKIDEKSGKRNKYDRDGVSFEEYVRLCEFFLTQGKFKNWAISVLEWNLMCRVNQINDLTSTRMKWVGDHLDILFTSTKTSHGKDKVTDEFSKRIFANPKDIRICPVTALGVYLLTSVTGSVKIFPANQEDKNFKTALQKAGKQLGFANYRYLGSHSLRKGAWTYSQSGTTACPSFAATCMRADHSLGNVKDRYFVKGAVSEAQDAYLGRILAGLDVMTEEFAVLPPHFVKDEEYVLEKIKICFSTNFEQLGELRFTGVLAKVLASVVHNIESLKTFCGINNKLFQSMLFRDPSILPRLRMAINTDLYKSNLIMAVGIPPHVAILSSVSKLDINVQEAIKKAFEEYGIGQPNVTKRWTTKKFEEMNLRLDKLTELFTSSSRPVSTQGNGTLRSSLPSGYTMPSFKFENGWSYWLFGDPSNSIPPFQFLSPLEFANKRCRAAFRGYRRVMRAVMNEVKKSHPTINFKKDFTSTNVVTNAENINKAHKYFKIAVGIVGPSNNGKYIAKTDKRYKSKPIGELSVSTIRRRLKNNYVVDV